MRDTPYLFVDRTRLEANLDAMAAHTRLRGVALRPHAKTHKCGEIARLQLERGAVGLTVATVSEAEIFAAHLTDVTLLIAYPIWAESRRAQRLAALAARTRLRVGADSHAGLERLARAVHGVTDASAGAETSFAVMIEIDSGHHRSGVDPDDAAHLARYAHTLGLDVAGVFTFPGHSYTPEGRQAAADDELRALRHARDDLIRAGLECAVVSGGSTPSTAFADGDGDVLTELRPGVYPFYDAQQWELGTVDGDRIALSAVATVVSVRAGRVIVDAGNKVLGADRLPFATGFGRLPDHPEARVIALSEHHATITGFAEGREPRRGDRLRIAPNHVCSAINLADELVVSPARGTRAGHDRHDGVEDHDVWAVIARGANT